MSQTNLKPIKRKATTIQYKKLMLYEEKKKFYRAIPTANNRVRLYRGKEKVDCSEFRGSSSGGC
jgi:hypothetical protein